MRRGGAGNEDTTMTLIRHFLLTCLALGAVPGTAWCAGMEWAVVAKDRKGFVLTPSGSPFVPWGLNYDHDTEGRLLEDYWDDQWPKVERDFRAMKRLAQV